jgi:hypothetical protein
MRPWLGVEKNVLEEPAGAGFIPRTFDRQAALGMLTRAASPLS